MTYSLRFKAEALREWEKLGAQVKKQFKKKLAELVKNPRIPASKLHGAKDRYKIKLRSSGFRLVYEVRNKELVISVIAVGKRDRGKVYSKAAKR